MLGAYGQTFRGAINGTVTDPTGAVVAGASVTATETATNVAHKMASTSNGEFSFQDLPPGTYSVAVSAAGFQQTTVTNVVVTAGNVYTVPVKQALRLVMIYPVAVAPVHVVSSIIPYWLWWVSP